MTPYQKKAQTEKNKHDRKAGEANEKAEQAESSTINSSAAGLGAYARKVARPRPTPTPTATATPDPEEAERKKKNQMSSLGYK